MWLLDKLFPKKANTKHYLWPLVPPDSEKTLAAEVCSALANRPNAWVLKREYFSGGTYIVHEASDIAVSAGACRYVTVRIIVGRDLGDLSWWEQRAVRKAVSRWLAWHLRSKEIHAYQQQLIRFEQPSTAS